MQSVWKQRFLDNPKKEGESQREYARRLSGIYGGSEKAIKTKINQHSALVRECEEIGIPVEDVKNYWWKGKHFSIHVGKKDVNLLDLGEEITENMKKYSPTYPTIYYQPLKDPHLLVISPADIHINKLCSEFETGEEYNHQIAVKRVKDGVTGLLHKSQPYDIEKILFIIGNDILHTDNAKSTTTSGTFQDTELMWFDAFNIAFQLYVDVIEMFIPLAPVHIQYDPDNHSYTTGFFLAKAISAWFNKNENITFDISPAHRKYFTYYNNLIGTTHGDGAKEADLPMLMAHESKDWSTCKFKYFYTHHIHHKKSRDYMSVCVESLRSPSGTDGWHSKAGFQHAPKAIEGFIHHREHGQTTRFSHFF